MLISNHKQVIHEGHKSNLLFLSPRPNRLRSSSSISMIPPELLQLIFDFCFDRPLATATNTTTLAFTQVCRAWRSLSLSTPMLWSTINLCDKPSAELCLSRSGEADLSLVAPGSSLAYEGPLVAVRHRIHSIDAVINVHFMSRLFKGMLVDPRLRAPASAGIGADSTVTLERLTDLNLRAQAASTCLDLSFVHIPSIRNLSLDFVKLDWALLVHGKQKRGFRSLSLTRVDVSMNELLVMIEQSDEVFLENVTTPNLSGVSRLNKISPPTLRKISIISHEKQFIDALISILVLPNTTKVVTRCLDNPLMFLFAGAHGGNTLGGLGRWNMLEVLGA
ncbi:hypothetical protein PM082_020029 [Marasmius tenuissimus]|nr:hypothetical protein PM082_020029 [Marasmius tenuissimus]